MTKLIAAAPVAPARKNAGNPSLLGYLAGSALFIAGVVALFAVGRFHL